MIEVPIFKPKPLQEIIETHEKEFAVKTIRLQVLLGGEEHCHGEKIFPLFEINIIIIVIVILE